MKSTPDINTRNSSEQQRAADPLALTEARLVDGYAGIGMTTISDEYLAQLRAKKLIADALSMTRNSVNLEEFICAKSGIRIVPIRVRDFVTKALKRGTEIRDLPVAFDDGKSLITFEVAQ